MVSCAQSAPASTPCSLSSSYHLVACGRQIPVGVLPNLVVSAIAHGHVDVYIAVLLQLVCFLEERRAPLAEFRCVELALLPDLGEGIIQSLLFLWFHS